MINELNWRTLPSNDKYEVSDCGSIRRIGKIVALKPWKHKSGHLYIRLGKRGRQIHHLVIEAFGDPRPDGMECRHLDGNPENNAISNLKWGTRKENIFDYINKHGRSPGYKSTPWEVALKIRQEHDGKKGTGKLLAAKYGVSQYTVSEIRNNKTFKYI